VITYVFDMDDGGTHRFVVDTQDKKDQRVGPDWTRLTHEQCTNCPLTEKTHPVCPAAHDLIDVIDAFNEISSTARVTVTVIEPERTTIKHCDLQSALRSLIGLIMANSGCPILGDLRGMARFHLPFSNRQETTFRVASSYLLKQYFLAHDDAPVDLKLQGLKRLYDSLKILNMSFAARLRSCATQDASLNAVTALFGLTNLVSFSLADDLEELREFLID